MLRPQVEHAREYMMAYGGPVPDKEEAQLRSATEDDLRQIFERIDKDGSGSIDMKEVTHTHTRTRTHAHARARARAHNESDGHAASAPLYAPCRSTVW